MLTGYLKGEKILYVIGFIEAELHDCKGKNVICP